MEGERSPSDAFGFALWRALQGALRARRSSSKITLASSENYESLDSSSVSASDRGASMGTQRLPTSSARALPATSPFLGEPKLRSTPKNSQDKREKSAGFVREHSRRRAVSQSFPERSRELGAASKTFVADSDGPTQLTAVYSNAQRRSSVDCSKSVDRSPAVDKDKHDEAIWRDASSLCAELERVALDLGGCNGPRGIALARKRWSMLRQRACVHGDVSRTGRQVALSTSSERSLTDTKVVSKSSIDLSELVMQFTDRVNMATSAWLSKVVSGTRRTTTKEIHEHQPTSSADPVSGQLTEMRTQAIQRNLCALECLTLLDLLGISPQQAKKMLLDHCATSMKLESDAALFRGFWERWECLFRDSSGHSISDTSEAHSSSESQRTWRTVLEVPRELFLRLEQIDMVRVLCLFELVDIEVFKSIAVEDISSAVLLLYAIGVSANDRIAKSQDETAVQICLSVLEVLSKWQQALTQSWRDHVIELETALLSIEHAIAAFVSVLCTSWHSSPSVSLWTRLDEPSTQRAYCAMQGVFETSVKALAFHAENPSHGHHYTLCCSVLSSFCTFLSSGNRERLTWLGNALLEGHSSVTADVMRSVAVGACLVIFRDIDAARAAKRLFLQLLGTPWRYRLLESASRLLESDPRPLEAETLAISSRGERDVGSNAKGATSGATSRSVEAEIKGHLVSADKEWALGSQPAAIQPETHSHPLPWFKNSEEHHAQSLALGSLHCLLCALYQKNLLGIAEGHGLSSALTLRIGQVARYWTRRSIYFAFEMIAALCYMLRAGTISLYADGTALALLVDISTNAIAHELRFSEKDTLTPRAGGSAPLHRAHETSRPGVAFETRTWRTCLEPSAERLVPRTIPISEGSNSQATSAPSAEPSGAATPLRESALTGDVAVGLQNAIQIFSESILDCMEQASVALFAAEPALLSFLERLIPFLAQRDRLRMLALRERYAQPVFDLETWVDRMQYILTLYLRDENARAVRLRAVRFLRDTFSTWKGLYADSFVAELVQPVLLGSWKDLRVTRGGCENPLDQTQPGSELEEELLHTIAVALSAPTSLPVFRRFINELVGLDEAVIPVVFAALETFLRESNIKRASLLLAILTDYCLPRTSWPMDLATGAEESNGRVATQRHLNAFCGFILRLTQDAPGSRFLQLDGRMLSIPIRLDESIYGIAVQTGVDGDKSAPQYAEWKRTDSWDGAPPMSTPHAQAVTAEPLEPYLADGGRHGASAETRIADRPETKRMDCLQVPVATWVHRLLGLLLESASTTSATDSRTLVPLDTVVSCLLHLSTDPGLGPVASLPSLNVYDQLCQWLGRSRSSAVNQAAMKPNMVVRHLAFEVLFTICLRQAAVAHEGKNRFGHLLEMVLAELGWQVDQAEHLLLHPPWIDLLLRIIVHGWCMFDETRREESMFSLTKTFLIALQTFAVNLVSGFLESVAAGDRGATSPTQCAENATAILESVHGLALCFREFITDAEMDMLQTLPIRRSGSTATGCTVEMLASSDAAATESGAALFSSMVASREATYIETALSIVITMVPLWGHPSAHQHSEQPVHALGQSVRLRRLAMAAWCNWVTQAKDVAAVQPLVQLLENYCRRYSCEWFGMIAAEFTNCFCTRSHIDRGPGYLLDKSVQQAPSVITWAIIAKDALPLIVTAMLDGDRVILAIRRVTGSTCLEVLLRQPPWSWYPLRAAFSCVPSQWSLSADWAEAQRSGPRSSSHARAQTSLPREPAIKLERETLSSRTGTERDEASTFAGTVEPANAASEDRSTTPKQFSDASEALANRLQGIVALLMHRHPLEEWRRLSQDMHVWQVLDRMPPEDIHRIGLLYVGAGQQGETEILANIAGDAPYNEFCASLGCFMNLTQDWMFAYTGGLDYSERRADGAFALYYRDAAAQVIFHTTTLMPSETIAGAADPIMTGAGAEPDTTTSTGRNDGRSGGLTRGRSTEIKSIIRKKRHVGNDHVKIFWCARREEARVAAAPGLLPGAFNSVHFTVTPAPAENVDGERLSGRLLYAQAHWHRSEIPRCGPLRASELYLLREARAAGFLVRLSAIHANILCGCWGTASRRGAATVTAGASTTSALNPTAGSHAVFSLGIEQEPWLRRLHYIRQQIERLSGQAV